MERSPFDIIRTRRAPEVESRLALWALMDDSYRGGIRYRNGGHLRKYTRESKEVHQARQARAVYFNFLQPIVDILVGFVFRNEPSRTIPKELEFLTEDAWRGKGMTRFMRDVAVSSMLYTVGILVDSPAFDTSEVRTEADRLARGLNPYPCVYYPHQIRDFAVDEHGQLLWVLLDDSRVDKVNPLEKDSKKTIYRLWTRTHSQEFEIIKRSATLDEWDVIPGEERLHPVGYVPFTFVNWRDVDDDQIADSPMEDVAILSEQIYNVLSLLDEMLHTGTFKTLFFPVQKPGDLDQDVVKSGLYDVAAVEYNGTLSGSPEFKGPGLSEVGPFIDAVKLYAYEIFRKVGMDVDRDKSYVQSGAAMGKEFQKTEALLRYGAEALQEAEEFIFRTAARWLGKDYDEQIEIEYSKEFQQQDIDLQLKRLFDVFNLGLRPLKQIALKGIVEKVFPNLDPAKVEELSQETEGSAPDWQIDGVDAASAITQARELITTQQEESTT